MRATRWTQPATGPRTDCEANATRSPRGAVVAALGWSSTDAVAQGLTFSVAPSGRWIEWDSELGFERTSLLGGALGLGFGRYVSITAYHHRDNDVLLRSALGESPFEVTTEIAQTGGQIALALGSGTFVPVVVGGGSLFRFKPEGADELTKLAFDLGGGVRASLGQTLTGEVLLESSRYRLDRARLIGTPPGEAAEPLLRNLSLRVGVGVQLGQRSLDRASDLDQGVQERYRSPLSNLALSVEPTVGRLDFAASTGLEEQDLVGLRAGFDFGSFVGLRGFHSWGTESGFGSFNGFKAWGGEVQFNLTSGPGLIPYLVGGVGLMDWDDLDDPAAPRPIGRRLSSSGEGPTWGSAPTFAPRWRCATTCSRAPTSQGPLKTSPNRTTWCTTGRWPSG